MAFHNSSTSNSGRGGFGGVVQRRPRRRGAETNAEEEERRTTKSIKKKDMMEEDEEEEDDDDKKKKKSRHGPRAKTWKTNGGGVAMGCFVFSVGLSSLLWWCTSWRSSRSAPHKDDFSLWTTRGGLVHLPTALLQQRGRPRRRRGGGGEEEYGLRLLLHVHPMNRAPPLVAWRRRRQEEAAQGGRRSKPDYGSLSETLDFLQEGGGARNIKRVQPPPRIPVWKWVDRDDDDGDLPYYAYDDDAVRHESCRRVAWHWDSHVNCNSFHEMGPLTDPLLRYLGRGYWRDAFHVLASPFGRRGQKVTAVLKLLQYHHPVRTDTLEFVRMDALVTEKLQARHSRHVVGMYGYCGTALLAEFMPGGTLEDVVVPRSQGHYREKDMTRGISQNSLTVRQTLQLALLMCQALAVVQGFPDGLILHGDVQISQFLLASTSTNGEYELKINDFNRAEVMIWDEKEQHYCTFENGEAYGLYRAPEEHLEAGLTEQMEIWSMGILFYMLVTGLHPYHHVEMDDDRVFSATVAEGATPYLHPSFAKRHAFLVQLMYRCWNMDPLQRPTVFQLVQEIQQALDNYKDEEEEEEEEWRQDEEEEDEWQQDDHEEYDDDEAVVEEEDYDDEWQDHNEYDDEWQQDHHED